MSKRPQDLVEVGKTYHHFKGGRYKVLHLGRDASTGHDVVVYQDLDMVYEEGADSEVFSVWVRPPKEWCDMVRIYRPRFSQIGVPKDCEHRDDSTEHLNSGKKNLEPPEGMQTC